MKYIIFLVDADRLFDTALGMYDFSLVLLIAQHAQKVCEPSRSFALLQRLTEITRTLANISRSFANFARSRNTTSGSRSTTT